jgi:hypothetical protein
MLWLPSCQRSTRRARSVIQSAGVALANVRLCLQLVRMHVLERPAAIRVALRRHDLDRLCDAPVRRDLRAAQVLEPAQDVVVAAPRQELAQLILDSPNSGRPVGR